MTEEFTNEIKARRDELKSNHAKLTGFWLDGKFQSETNFHIGRALDFINKSMDELNKLIK